MRYDFVDSIGYDNKSSEWTDRDRLQWERGRLAGLARALNLTLSGHTPNPNTGNAMFGTIRLERLHQTITFQEERIAKLLKGDEEE